MSETVPPPDLDGEISSGSLEFLWEKYKRWVYVAGLALVLFLGAKYILRYMDQQESDALWGGLATSTHMDRGYSEDFQGLDTAREQQDPEQAARFVQMFAGMAKQNLVGELDATLASADLAEIESAMAEAKGTAAEPLFLWILANRSLAEDDADGALSRLDQLEKSFPNHFLTTETDSPVQWRKEIKKDEDDEVETPTRKEPEYEPAVAGSASGRLRAQILADRQFKAEHGSLYTAKEPDSEQAVILEFDRAGETLAPVKIQFFAGAAPTHIKRFLELAGQEEPFWKGMRIHEIQRAGENSAFVKNPPSELQFGWPSTREDERASWKAEDIADENKIEWEGARAGLSHFPGTVSVLVDDGKSQVERVAINGDDVAANQDGRRVIIGRVVEGLDTIKTIIDDSGFQDDTATTAGRGQPEDNITITTVQVQ